MLQPFKSQDLADIVVQLRQRKRAVLGATGLALALMAGPFLLSHAGLEKAAATHSAGWRDPSWVGGLEAPKSSAESATPQALAKPMTSSSYTSGFDEKAAGLEPLPPEDPARRPAEKLRNSLACPDDLNCSFRSARAAPVAPPRRRPVISASAKPVKVAATQSGFVLPLLPAHLSLPTPHLSLPSAGMLLTPFTYVSNTVVGFVKKM